MRRDRERVDQLSQREQEVLLRLARDRSNKEIARELGIGEETVKTHVSNVLGKLHLADRRQGGDLRPPAAVIAARWRSRRLSWRAG